MVYSVRVSRNMYEQNSSAERFSHRSEVERAIQGAVAQHDRESEEQLPVDMISQDSHLDYMLFDAPEDMR